MKTATALLLAGSTLLAGFGLGILFANGGGAAPLSAAGDVGEGAPLGGDAREFEVAARRAAGGATPASAARPDVTPVSEATLARARARITPADGALPSADASTTIHGQVASQLGEPIAGAVVVATLGIGGDPHGEDPRDASASDPDGPSLDEVLAARANDWARSRVRQLRAVSAADGSYTLGPLPEGIYRVAGYHDDWSFAAGDQVPEVAAGSRHDVIGRRLTRYQIDVRLPDGTRPAMASLDLRQTGGTWTRAKRLRWTPEAREIPIDDGPGTVAAAADFVTAPEYAGHGPARLASDRRRLTPGEPITLELRPQRGIYGRVVAPELGRIHGRAVLLDLSRTPTANAAAFRAQLESGNDLQNGGFSFVDLEPGEYAVGVLSWSRTLLAHATAAVGDAMTELVLEVGPPDRDASLRVLCLGPDGVPLHHVRFEATTASGDEKRHAGFDAAMRGPDGFWWLPHAELWPPDGDLPAGAVMRLVASHPTLGSARAEARPATRELTLAFEPPCALLVEVPGYADRRAGSARYGIQIAPKGESEKPPEHYFGTGSRSVELLADGTAWIDGLSRGSYWVQLSNPGRWNQRLGGTVVEVEGARTRWALPMPSTHTLILEGPDLGSGTHLWIESGVEDPMMVYHDSGMLGGDRRCVLHDVPAGRYTVNGTGFRSRSDVVVPGGPYTLERERIDCLRVSISKSDGTLYRAGLRIGDLVTAVNGVVITHDTWWRVLRDEGRKHNVPVTVLRDGVTIEIPGGDHGWQGHESELGGVLTPASRNGG